MNYRQWKKNYKKLHRGNPPLELDKRKQCRLAKKAIKTTTCIDFVEVVKKAAETFTIAYASVIRGIGAAFNAIGNMYTDIADYIQPSEGIKGNSQQTEQMVTGILKENED